MPPFLPVAPPGNLVILWGAGLDAGWPVSVGLQHCFSSLGVFPTDSFNHYFTWLLSRVRSLEEELEYSTEVSPFCSFSSKKQFAWILSSSWALQLQSHWQSCQQQQDRGSHISVYQSFICLGPVCALSVLPMHTGLGPGQYSSTLGCFLLPWLRAAGQDFQCFSVELFFFYVKGCSHQPTGWLWVLTTSQQLQPRLCSSYFAAFGPGTFFFFFVRIFIQKSNRFCSVAKVYLYLSVVNLINQFLLPHKCYTLFICTMCLLPVILHFHSACSRLLKFWLKGKWQTCEQLHMENCQSQQRMLSSLKLHIAISILRSLKMRVLSSSQQSKSQNYSKSFLDLYLINSIKSFFERIILLIFSMLWAECFVYKRYWLSTTELRIQSKHKVGDMFSQFPSEIHFEVAHPLF